MCCVPARGHEKVTLSVYVDDMLMIATSQRLLQASVKNLGKEVEFWDLGESTYILEIQVQRARRLRTVTISQPKYGHEILKCFSMEDFKPVKMPVNE